MRILAAMLGVALSFTVTGHASVIALASAATITVNSTADNTTASDGQCTLREAIANVNASADTTGGDCTAGTGSGDTITFALGLPAKITLLLGELDIGQNVAIAGPPTGSLRVRGHGSRVFAITAGATSISNLVIQHGADGWGGGIYNVATVTLSNCTVSGNQAGQGGGIYNAGAMTLTNSTLSGNQVRFNGIQNWGGAIYNNGTMTLTNCTLSHNQANGGEGGGIFGVGGTMTLTNCTLNRNKAYQDGGGIVNDYASMATLTNCTLSGNSVAGGRTTRAGGIVSINGNLTLLNTIVAKNRNNNCNTLVISNGHNLDSDGTCVTSSGTDLVNTDPILRPLGNYGGPTKTMALCTGVACGGVSPAIDTGDDAVLGPPYNLTTDQRGLPRDAGTHVDIGAYEAQ